VAAKKVGKSHVGRCAWGGILLFLLTLLVRVARASGGVDYGGCHGGCG